MELRASRSAERYDHVAILRALSARPGIVSRGARVLSRELSRTDLFPCGRDEAEELLPIPKERPGEVLLGLGCRQLGNDKLAFGERRDGRGRLGGGEEHARDGKYDPERDKSRQL